MKYAKNFAALLLALLAFGSCKKFLDAKPDRSLTIPKTIYDVQILLDNNERMNTNCPWMGEGSADGYYYTQTDWNAATNQSNKNAYLWGPELMFSSFPNDWSCSYDPIYFSNIALETLDGIERTNNNALAWDNAKGSALFYRAKHWFTTATLWAKAWDSQSAAIDLGIPLRTSSDFNKVSVRSTMQQTYDQVIADAKQAAAMLPASPLHVMRPSVPAAYALLARVYLSMRAYDSAAKYADLCLQQRSTLLDFTTLNAASTYPIAAFNAEVIMHFAMRGVPAVVRGKIDTLLYNSYASNDLRKTIYYKANGDGSYQFRGSYAGTAFNFTGFAVDEMLLTRAECAARKGNTAAALSDLNTLLAKRWKAGTFVFYTATSPEDALDKVLIERRKELVLRDTRWMDIKRLNMESANITIKRVLDNQAYLLPPKDNRYALPIPETVINLSGIQQNPR